MDIIIPLFLASVLGNGLVGRVLDIGVVVVAGVVVVTIDVVVIVVVVVIGVFNSESCVRHIVIVIFSKFTLDCQTISIT